MSFFGEIGEFLSNPFSYAVGVYKDIISWMLPSFESTSLDGVLVNKQSNNAPIPVIYGKRRVGGTRIYVNTSGASKQYLQIILVLAEGEINSIGDVYFDGIINTDSKFSGLISSEVKKTGANPQTTINLAGPWANNNLDGVAYYSVQLLWNNKTFSNIPEITCDVYGKKVYNPATGVTAYSANPALCLRDYLTNTVYGKGLPTSAIDDTLFNAAKTRCDTSVTNYTGGVFIKEFECNAVLDTSRSLMDNTKILLSGMRGIMPFSQGKYGLLIESEQVGSNLLDLNESHIIGGISINSGNQSGRYNQVSVTFVNPDANWQSDEVFYPPADTASGSDQTLFRAADGGKVLLGKATLSTITDRYSAMGIAEAMLKRSRFGKTVSIKVTSEALILTAGDIVSITHSTPAWVSKKFRVLSTTLAVDGTIDLSLIEHDDSIYPWSTKTELNAHSDTTLPDLSEVVDPTSLTAVSSGNAILNEDGSIVPVVQLSWTASADAFVEEYNVEVISSGTVIQELRTSTTGYEIRGLNIASTYTFKVYAVNSLGIKSTGVTSSAHTVSGKTANPADPTSPSVTAKLESLVLEWTNPSDSDFSHVEIRRHSTSTFSSATQIATIKGDTYIDNIGPALTRYYWIRAVDTTGNASGWTTVVNATSTGVTASGVAAAGAVMLDETADQTMAGALLISNIGDSSGTKHVEFDSVNGRLKVLGEFRTAANVRFRNIGDTDNILDFDATREVLKIGKTSSTGSFVGPLGIGAGGALEVLTIHSSTSGEGSIWFADGPSVSGGIALPNSYRGWLSYSHATDSMTIGTSGSTRFTVSSTGKVTLTEDLRCERVTLDGAFYENSQTVTADYTLTAGKNAMSAGPITVNAGVTVTVPSGAAWTII
tara:strand:- start:199 stop:2844 length:2646 start_codon:yes stop_codon:yes gene_type:complete